LRTIVVAKVGAMIALQTGTTGVVRV
jgi:uncharacterized protein YkvS